MLRLEAILQPRLSVPITSSVTGMVKRVEADLGDTVKQGQLLVELEAPELADDLEEARAVAELEGARLGQVESRLGKEGSSGTTQADRHVALAQLKVAQVRLHKLKKRMEAYRLTSPIDGVISKRVAHVGELVRAETAMELLTVSDLSRLRADVFVSQDDVRELDTAVRVVFRSVSKSAAETTGKIMRKAVDLDGLGMRRTVLEFDNASQKFGPGQKGTVTIELADRKGVLSIPVRAIVNGAGNGQATCYRVVDGRALLTYIKLGLWGYEATREALASGSDAAKPKRKIVEISEVLRVEVVEGLKEGDRVLSNPGQIKDGQAIETSR
jgi:RND family efflux transporter MFP subunit